MISSTKYPTTNIYFPQICEINMALSEWVNSPNEVIQKMAEKMLEKFDSYWSVIHVIMGVSVDWFFLLKSIPHRPDQTCCVQLHRGQISFGSIAVMFQSWTRQIY